MPHTEGPWAINDSEIEHEASGMSICTMRSSDDFPCISEDETETEEEKRAAVDAECQANAHLIAAAPELLDALRKLRTAASTIKGLPSEDPDLKAALAEAERVIAKAYGATP